jgi:hypothetical protein
VRDRFAQLSSSVGLSPSNAHIDRVGRFFGSDFSLKTVFIDTEPTAI